MMMLVTMSVIGSLHAQPESGRISGVVTDRESGLYLDGCEIVSKSGRYGTASDSLGRYQLVLPTGKYQLSFFYLGYRSTRRLITINRANQVVSLNVELEPQPLSAPGTITTANREDNVAPSHQIAQLDIRQMPTLHNDVIRSLKILPGVSSNNELGSAYNVRGGSYDENLIYLNGYEIFRPYLLRSGAEESQTIVNGDLVSRLTFYAGGFPAQYGDRMSSALSVAYRLDGDKQLRGTLRADLLNTGFSARQRLGNISWSAGIRYANPALFLNRLQSQGDYKPLFRDGQLLVNWQLKNNLQLELFGLAATNQFDLTPEEWIGNFQVRRLDVRTISIEYNGQRIYRFRTQLAGLRSRWQINPSSTVTTSLAHYRNRETDRADISSTIFYSPDATRPNQNRQQLKTGNEQINNELSLSYSELSVTFSHRRYGTTWEGGTIWRTNRYQSRVNESYQEFGDSSLLQAPTTGLGESKLTFDYPQAFARLLWQISGRITADIGLRGFYYGLNEGVRFSPRLALRYQASEHDIVNFTVGDYYQPPGYHELRLRTNEQAGKLDTQRARHFIIGWERPAGRSRFFRGEIFFKDLDNLLPFFQEELTLRYGDQNNYEGYSAGIDLQISGEFIPGANSWVSYSYLYSRERPQGSPRYQRRLLDQAHTFRLFLQDRAPRHQNILGHLRVLFGSGYLYRPRTIETDLQSGESVLAVNFQRINKFTHYARADLGITIHHRLSNERNLTFTVEVLNVFDNRNTVSNSWYQIFPDNPNPFRVPHLLSPRFFNAGFELHY